MSSDKPYEFEAKVENPSTEYIYNHGLGTEIGYLLIEVLPVGGHKSLHISGLSRRTGRVLQGGLRISKKTAENLIAALQGAVDYDPDFPRCEHGYIGRCPLCFNERRN
jgi:hypothetical protein